MFQDLVLKNRSYRKFDASHPVSMETLEQLINLARTVPSSKNRQPLKFLPLVDKNNIDLVFKNLKWAAHLKDWGGPAEGERPSAYIIVLLDTGLNDNAEIDTGIASQTILLGAAEMGLGGCIIRTVNRFEIIKHFHLPQQLELMLIIALGKPVQDVRITEVEQDGNTNYFEDSQGIHYVPKRNLNDIILKLNP